MKRGQAALEFLMTYGWAILVVLLSIGALAYFGVLNPSRFLPDSCTIAPGFSCDEFKATPTTIVLQVRNGMGEDLRQTNLSVPGCTISATQATWNDGTILGGASGITLTGCTGQAVNSKLKKSLNVSYLTPGGLMHVKIGEIVTRVEAV